MRARWLRIAVLLLLAGCARTEEVTFRNGQATLAGTLLLPRGKGPFPAIVFVHGDGCETREGYRFFAEQFVKRGFAALVYDKRGCGRSTGRFPARFSELAGDAVAGIQFLRARREVDGARIGLWGGSQGGWIAPLAAASRDARIKFVIVKAGTPVTPAELARWKSVERVRRAGHGDEAIAQVHRLMDLQFAILRTGDGWDTLAAAVHSVRNEPWLPQVAIMRHSRWRSSWMTYATDIDFDPMATLARVDAPMLWLFGEKDPETPLAMSVQRLEELRRRGKEVAIKVFLGADHQVELPRQSPRRPNFAPGYVETMVEWAVAAADGASRRSSTTSSAPP